MVFVCLFFMSGAPEGSTDSGSDFKRPRDGTTVSSDILVKPGIELRASGYKSRDLSNGDPRWSFLYYGNVKLGSLNAL